MVTAGFSLREVISKTYFFRRRNLMSDFQIVVCGSLVPDPLQTLEPLSGATAPSLKNEMMLPTILDPWAAHALYEAANLAKKNQGSKIYLVSLGPKGKLQQLMMSVAQKVGFELIAIDGSASGFTEPYEVSEVLASAIKSIPNLDMSKLLLFGGCSSASRDAGVTMQLVAERLGISDFFLGVDELIIEQDGKLTFKERVEAGQYLVSTCSAPPVAVGWSTGTLPVPPNNPQLGMMNMRGVLPALQKAKSVKVSAEGVAYSKVEQPSQRRDTRIVKDTPVETIVQELVEWLRS